MSILGRKLAKYDFFENLPMIPRQKHEKSLNFLYPQKCLKTIQIYYRKI